jgi:regulator of nucleoside diphosphate kinase
VDISVPIERTLTHHDHRRLSRLLAQHTAGAEAEALQDLLETSELVATAALAPTVVSMNTRVLLEDAATGTRYPLTLCYPQDAHPAEGRISVLSPVGASLLGLRAGETARWRTPSGQEGAARIVAVLFQPSADGERAS